MELRFASNFFDDFDHLIVAPVGMSGVELGQCSFVLYLGLRARLYRSPHRKESVGVVVGIDLEVLDYIRVAGDSDLRLRLSLIADSTLAAQVLPFAPVADGQDHFSVGSARGLLDYDHPFFGKPVTDVFGGSGGHVMLLPSVALVGERSRHLSPVCSDHTLWIHLVGVAPMGSFAQ